jgi:hypothetical protein
MPFYGKLRHKKKSKFGYSALRYIKSYLGYDEPFVSKFKYYLSSNKIDFNALKQGKKQ